MPLTPYAKNQIAKLMLQRGEAFLGSALLLKKNNGNFDVVLHNLCQGIEIILKSFLLLSDYDKYNPKLPRTYGHKLVKVANDVISEFGLKALAAEELKELESLDNYYRRNYLRYAGGHDFFIPSTYLEYEHILRKILASLKLARREIK